MSEVEVRRIVMYPIFEIEKIEDFIELAKNAKMKVVKKDGTNIRAEALLDGFIIEYRCWRGTFSVPLFKKLREEHKRLKQIEKEIEKFPHEALPEDQYRRVKELEKERTEIMRQLGDESRRIAEEKVEKIYETLINMGFVPGRLFGLRSFIVEQ